MLITSGLVEMQPGPPCVSILRFGTDAQQHAPSVDHLSTTGRTFCLLMSPAHRLFAAGDSSAPYSAIMHTCCMQTSTDNANGTAGTMHLSM